MRNKFEATPVQRTRKRSAARRVEDLVLVYVLTLAIWTAGVALAVSGR